eukprot:jgi/Undpi1/1095/HiC_scaffold_10.g04558.m1
MKEICGGGGDRLVLWDVTHFRLAADWTPPPATPAPSPNPNASAAYNDDPDLFATEAPCHVVGSLDDTDSDEGEKDGGDGYDFDADHDRACDLRGGDEIGGNVYQDDILTFDEFGVSGHADHAAVNRGVSQFLQLRAAGVGDDGSALDAFALSTTGIIRKYFGLLDLPLSLALSYPPPLGATFLSFDARTAWRAMTAHRSQFVWYRRLFVIFSRYVYVNTFRRMQLPPPPRQMAPPPEE